MSRTVLLVIPLALASLLAAGCDPFSPDLGERPFRCAAVEPRCPESYVPIGEGESCNCEVPGLPGQDAGPEQPAQFVCSDDTWTGDPGGNDGLTTATPLGLDPKKDMTVVAYTDLAICSEDPNDSDDEDFFSFKSPKGYTVEVVIQFPDVTGQLHLFLLDASGTRRATSTKQVDQRTLLYPIETDGTYYVQVRGTNKGTRNNYTLQVTLQPPAED